LKVVICRLKLRLKTPRAPARLRDASKLSIAAVLPLLIDFHLFNNGYLLQLTVTLSPGLHD
jgi:hypothetical protein